MNPWHIVDGECIKRKFGTEFSALRFLSETKRKIATPLTPYICPVCGAWHLSTSKDAPSGVPVKIEPVELKKEHPDAAYWAKRLHKKSKPILRTRKRWLK